MTDSSVIETTIAYFERRLDQSTAQAAAAAGTSSRASHMGLAELYEFELAQLRGRSELLPSANPLLDRAREAGVIGQFATRSPKPKLTLGWTRSRRE